MKRMFLIWMFFFGLVLSWSLACFGEFYVIPVKKKNFAPVAKTGQTMSYRSGDDGDLQKGVPWPDPRFTDNGNGTVTDNMTGLIWLKNGSCYGARNWAEALSDANGLASGSCGLTDGSIAGDWRLANVREISSLTDFSRSFPALPAGHLFTNVQPSFYWSSTTIAGYTVSAWTVPMHSGGVHYDDKGTSHYVWPVRSGN